ncbi:uncharacterized protein LOC129290278 [Prosopis cineraria]|uniref:uncharacterized protein LOC129290278 n=1 Tax=Prosopis cineraria TaxID=364024 RepID=UPI00240F6867|nr:uncharacterized protein LOC129290278 [Prosopis cineraria]
MISLDDDKTVMQFWVPTKLNPNKPNLTLIHGFGGSSRWQFCCQIWHLSRKVNLFVPDLLFFGNSNTGQTDRSDVFQAICVAEGMKKLGVYKFSVAGISYGGYVSYRIGEMYPGEVDKVVIVSSGICYTEEQKMEHLKKIGRSPLELLVPEKPQDLRCLLNLCLHRFNWLTRLPDFILQEAIKVVLKDNRKEKQEILEYLLNREADSNPGILRDIDNLGRQGQNVSHKTCVSVAKALGTKSKASSDRGRRPRPQLRFSFCHQSFHRFIPPNLRCLFVVYLHYTCSV